MRGAWARVLQEIRKFRNLADNLKLEDVEGDASLFVDVVAVLRAAATFLEMRLKYINVVPWNSSQADTLGGEASFLVGATSLPFHQQDGLTQFL